MPAVKQKCTQFGGEPSRPVPRKAIATEAVIRAATIRWTRLEPARTAIRFEIPDVEQKGIREEKQSQESGEPPAADPLGGNAGSAFALQQRKRDRSDGPSDRDQRRLDHRKSLEVETEPATAV
jgi:hypothetical protein